MMIDEIKFHGDWKRHGNRYTELDFKILTNERAQNRLIDKFAKCDHQIDMHFYKGHRSIWNNVLEGPRSSEWVAQRFGIDIPDDCDKISVLITSNIGSPKYPLTPWIIAHRISHSLYRQYGFRLLYHITESLWGLMGGNMFDKWMGRAIGTMRSCRNRTLVSSNELVHELFAQLMLTGRITLNHIEGRVLKRMRGRNAEYVYFTPSKVDLINSYIDRLENSIYQLYDCLHENYGNVIVV